MWPKFITSKIVQVLQGYTWSQALISDNLDLNGACKWPKLQRYTWSQALISDNLDFNNWIKYWLLRLFGYIKSAMVDISLDGWLSVGLYINPLLLNNLINGASPTQEPPLHSEVFDKLDSLLPLRMTIALRNSSNEIHVNLFISWPASELFPMSANRPSHIRPRWTQKRRVKVVSSTTFSSDDSVSLARKVLYHSCFAKLTKERPT